MRTILPILLLFASIGTYAQGFYAMDSIQTIEIVFAQSNWDQLLDAQKAGNEDYIMAQSVTINGVMFDSVGVKYKGNSTYNANQTKNPLHIELDTYKDHIYEAYTDIKLSNVAKDPSFLREVLSYQIIRQYMDAPLSNYANVYINGALMGLYSNSESISKKFVDNRFYSKSNTFVKCNPPAGAGPQSNDLPNLVYLGQDSTNYYDAYEIKSDGGWQELIDLCDTLDNHLSEIESILDVDRALWMLAFNNVLVNLDSYSGGFSQNYYLYRDDNGRFLPVVWDLNESFGTFSMTGSGNLNSTFTKRQMSHLLHSTDSDFPLISQLLSVPMYKRMYLAHIKTMVEENFDNGSYYVTAQSLQNTIQTSVQADVNKFFTYAQFLSNITTDITSGGGPGGGSSTPGITSLMNGRSSYLLALSDFTQTEPAISNIALSNNTPLLNEVVSVTSTVSDAVDVYIGSRSSLGGVFQRAPMYDDGAHNDGAAGDGVYGADLTISGSTVQYYIYAENSGIGKFSPQRAEHEYHSVSADLTVQSGDIVINEFMASNDATVADQDGEYDDWIELYNNGTSSIDLSGYYLSDDSTDLFQWTFPSGSLIDADGYLIVWADDDVAQAGLHANFKLSASGETLYLVDATGVLVDQVTFGAQITDSTYGRFPNGTGSFQLMAPTYNAENVVLTVQAGDVVINEFMASNDTTVADQDGEYDDWIELYNNGTSSMDLSGWYLSDDITELDMWTFPSGSSIDADGYLIIWADDDSAQVGLHANFKLSASGETIYLVDSTGSVVDQITYGAQITDQTYGRFPNGTGSFQIMPATYDAENMTSVFVQTGDVVINEFMASNDTTVADQDGEYDDWIELYNNGTASVDLTGYSLSDDATDLMLWSFPDGTSIDADGYLIIWADDDSAQVGLHANFKLSASGETLYLVDASGAIADQITFGEQVTDSTYGRFPNGTGSFQLMAPTYNAENMVTTGTEDAFESVVYLKVIPNPIRDSFVLEIDQETPALSEVAVYTLNGAIVFRQNTSENLTIDSSQWASGMYVVKVGNSFLKIVKR